MQIAQLGLDGVHGSEPLLGNVPRVMRYKTASHVLRRVHFEVKRDLIVQVSAHSVRKQQRPKRTANLAPGHHLLRLQHETDGVTVVEPAARLA